MRSLQPYSTLIRALSTYSTVALQANASYQMQFASLVKEYYEADVFPVPLSIFEMAIDKWMERDTSRDDGTARLQGWGRCVTAVHATQQCLLSELT